MELFTIPFQDKFIIYRPLRHLAFVGNQAMADVALAATNDFRDVDVPEDVLVFLTDIGFLEPDPPKPPMPDHDFRPTTAVLLLTNRCNLRCTYCYANAGEMPAADLSFELAKVAIDHVYQTACELGRQQFELSFHGGGEPMQAWAIMKEATAYARSKDLRCSVSMVSNGVWSPSQREWVLNNMDEITISIDGGPETQNRQRPLVSGVGSAHTVMETITALDAAEFRYGIRMTAVAPWREQFPEDVRYLCENTGCLVFQVEPAFNVNRGEHQTPTFEEGDSFADGFMAAFEIAAQSGRNLAYSGVRLGLVTREFCTAPYNALIVNAAGQLVTCYEIASDNHTLATMSTIGNVVDLRIDIDDHARNRLLNFLEDKQDDHCRDCFCQWHCAGDCYARASVPDGDTLRASKTRCYINRQLTARMLLRHIMQGDGVWVGNRTIRKTSDSC